VEYLRRSIRCQGFTGRRCEGSAINSFAGSEQLDDATVREALTCRPGCPLIRMDARDPESCLVTLIGPVGQYAPARSAAA
jgi:hypothetical protein